MGTPPRRLLYRSGIWEVSRPRVPLTLGHVSVRLTDPSVSFTERSATDWMFCHNIARKALRAVLAADRYGLMFAYGWHPIGDAIGEPAAESSTPTFHLFGRWPGETLAPADQLLLPASHRLAPPARVLDQVDDELRAELQRAAMSSTTASAPEPSRAPIQWAGQAQTEISSTALAETGHEVAAPADAPPSHRALNEQRPVAAAKWKATQKPGSGHRVFTPVRLIRTVSDVSPQELLALATGLSALPRGGSMSGFSCVAAEADGPDGRLQLHAFGRSAAEEINPLEELLESTEVSHTLL